MSNLHFIEKSVGSHTYQCSFIFTYNAAIWCPMIRPWPRFANLEDNERLDGKHRGYDSYLALFLRIQFGGTCKPTRRIGLSALLVLWTSFTHLRKMSRCSSCSTTTLEYSPRTSLWDQTEMIRALYCGLDDSSGPFSARIRRALDCSTSRLHSPLFEPLAFP